MGSRNQTHHTNMITENTINTPTKLSKAMGEALYSLFGPNGQDVPVHTSETKRLAAFMELARQGIVYLQATEEKTIFQVRRQQRHLKAAY